MLFWKRAQKQPIEQVERRVNTVARDIDQSITRLEYLVNRELARIRAEEECK